MELIPEWAPNIHPMLVHFPLAILSVAIFVDFISFFLSRKQKWWTKEATAFLYGMGAVVAIVVYFTGKAAADSVFLPAEAQTVLNTHANWALWTVWFYSIYAALRILFTWKAPEKHLLKLHIGFFTLSLVGLFLLFRTGGNGAKMVFKHGVGVQATEVENSEQNEHEKTNGTQTEATSTAFNISDNGDWVWGIESGAVQALENNFRFLKGSAQSLNAKAVQTDSNSYALQLSGKNLDGFFVTKDSYKNVQTDYYLDISDFNGTFTMVNHVQDTANYDYLSISPDGTVIQARMVKGQPEVFEKGQISRSKPLFVRVVVNGEHFHGYVNKQVIVHGHGEEAEPGAVGFKFEGSGTLLIDKITLTQLEEH